MIERTSRSTPFTLRVVKTGVIVDSKRLGSMASTAGETECLGRRIGAILIAIGNECYKESRSSRNGAKPSRRGRENVR
jgi:hypothetical protein